MAQINKILKFQYLNLFVVTGDFLSSNRRTKLNRYFLYYMLIFTIISITSLGKEEGSIPIQSLPIEYYIKSGLLPEDLKIEKKFSDFSDIKTEDNTVAKTFANILTQSGIFQIDLSRVTKVGNQGITIENIGDINIYNPWVVANSQKNWYSISTILSETLGNETDPKKRAFLIWKLIKQNRYHWYPAEADYEVHSPVKFLNIYGYGLCDDSANNSEALFKSAGFTQARCWGLSGHVVPEVYYNSAWHVFDSDLEVFYPMLNNINIAGVKDCADNGTLVNRVSGTLIEQLYTSTGDNIYYQNDWNNSFNMSMLLRPGERLERYWYNWGKFHDNYQKAEPPYYGNGRVVYSPDFGNDIYSAGFETLQNIERVSDNGGYLHTLESENDGIMVCRMSSPYVFVGGSIYLRAYIESDNSEIFVEASKDNYAWQTVKTYSGAQTIEDTISLDSFIAPLDSSACYYFFIRLKLKENYESTLELNNVAFTGDIQCAPVSLPALKPYTKNNMNVTFSASGSGKLKITQDILEFEDESVLVGFTEGIYPPDKTEINTTTPKLLWKTEKTTKTISQHEVMVSWDAKGTLPVSPALWQTIGDTPYFYVPDGWLLDNSKYYWRVKVKDSEGNWGKWSIPYTFTINEKSQIENWEKY